jgi:uncharacterized protein
VAAPLFWAAFGLVVGFGGTAPPLTTLLLLVLVVPVLEELVFRGLVQGALLERWPRQRLGPLSAANALTSFLFAVSHLVYRAPLWAAAVFVPSLVFGYFRERHGTLASPILLHCWYNAGFFWLFG